MGSKRDLERRLSALRGFDDPAVDLEQYETPAPLAASIVHVASLHGDLADRTVVDLGTGTGILAIGAAMRGAGRVLGVERDPSALAIARANATRVDPPGELDWFLGDAARAPFCPETAVTVLMNPPFGAQRGNVHADRPFLETAARVAAVSYSVHNAESHDFVDAFAADHGGAVTHAFAATIELDRRFRFHTQDGREQPVEVFRIEWGSDP